MKCSQLIEGRRLAKNSVINLVGQLTPLIAAFVSIPLLIKGLGTDRFGFLTVAWMVIGYFSLFDMGLGRALTQITAQKIGSEEADDIPFIAWTALTMMTLMAFVVGIAIYFIAGPLVNDILNIPNDLAPEATQSMKLLALSPALVVLTTGLLGLLEAYQRFTVINIVRIPMGLYSFLAPLAVLPFSNSLAHIVAVLVVGRFIGLAIHVVLCLKYVPNLSKVVRIDLTFIKPLLGFGGWMTVSNIIAPLMLYVDRFIICSIISLEAVAFYTTPFDVVTKLWIIPGAIMGVLFPALSTVYNKDVDRAKKLYHQSFKYLALLIFPVVAGIILFAKPGLKLWIDEDFALQSFRVMQLLAAGVFVSCMAQPSFNLIQSAGRPDITAKLHMIELPLYLIYFWPLVHKHGITGAAFAWLIRVSISCTVLTIIASSFLRVRTQSSKSVGPIINKIINGSFCKS